ncbi:SAF domain-containing protein [Candidatus Chloroploca asiatica]|uniref:Flagellar biosynthesis protein FlgA n=1 Tax=Candidatus Chloroploca asiatica TaxID=1506545 RepID=A0A2H3KY38_9CHLR|nr:SAF domain-containing protein [Candidatus Chloroploca asiatica]PDW00463.1 flagellar biosynthesis protein FlgA [Candidatus Chloroploca asiatica]
MTTMTPNAPSLGQALTRKKASPLPVLMLAAGLIAAIAFAVMGYLESQRTEQVVVLIHEVPFGQQLVAEDLGMVEVPLHRPVPLAGITDASLVIGQYAARNLGVNDLVQPGMLMAAPPDQPVYPNGEQLTVNMVPVPFSVAALGPVNYRDRVNLGFSDPSGDPALCDEAIAAAAGEAPSRVTVSQGELGTPRPYACRLLSSVRVLWIEGTTAYLEMTPYQAHTIWALQAAGLPMWGERYGSTSEVLSAFDRLDIGQVTLPALLAPAPEGEAADVDANELPGTHTSLPGANSPVPGSEQP